VTASTAAPTSRSYVPPRKTKPPARLSNEDRWAIAEKIGVNLAYVIDCEETCFDWALSNGQRKVDWVATVRNWVRKEKRDRPGAPGPETRQSSLPFHRPEQVDGLRKMSDEEREEFRRKFREETKHLRRGK